MTSLAVAAFRKCAVRSVKGAVDVRSIIRTEELDKIAVHVHKSERLSKDAVDELLKASILLMRKEANIVHIGRQLHRPARTLLLANNSFTHEELLRLTSHSKLHYPSRDNHMVFMGYKFDKEQDKLRALLCLLVMKLYSPDSVHILRSRSYQQVFHASHEESTLPSIITKRLRTLEHSLPAGLVLDNSVLMVNGGIGHVTSSMTLEEIQKLNRTQEQFSSILDELVLAEPQSAKKVKSLAPDTPALLYSNVQFQSFLKLNGLQSMVRNQLRPIRRVGSSTQDLLQLQSEQLQLQQRKHRLQLPAHLKHAFPKIDATPPKPAPAPKPEPKDPIVPLLTFYHNRCLSFSGRTVSSNEDEGSDDIEPTDTAVPSDSDSDSMGITVLSFPRGTNAATPAGDTKKPQLQKPLEHRLLTL